MSSNATNLEENLHPEEAAPTETSLAKTYWEAANFFISSVFISLLLVSNFVGTWGVVAPTPDSLKIFPQAFCLYIFCQALPLRWLLSSLVVYLFAAFYLKFLNLQEISFGYQLGLFAAVFLATKLDWKFWLILPISIHACGIAYISFYEIVLQHQELSLITFITKAFSLSKDSLTFELLLVYPTVFTSRQLNKLVNVFRLLE